MEPNLSATSLLFSFHILDQNGQSYKVHLNPFDLHASKAYVNQKKDGRQIQINFHHSLLSVDLKNLAATFFESLNPPLICINAKSNDPTLSNILLKFDINSTGSKRHRIYLISPSSKGDYRIRLTLDKTFKVISSKFCPRGPELEEVPQILLDSNSIKKMTLSQIKEGLKNQSFRLKLIKMQENPLAHSVELLYEGPPNKSQPITPTFVATQGQNAVPVIRLIALETRLQTVTNSCELMHLPLKMLRENPILLAVFEGSYKLFENVEVLGPVELHEIAELLPILEIFQIKKTLHIALSTLQSKDSEKSENFLKLDMLAAWSHLIQNVRKAAYKGLELEQQDFLRIIPYALLTKVIKSIKPKFILPQDREKIPPENLKTYLEALWSFISAAVRPETLPQSDFEAEMKIFSEEIKNDDLDVAYIANCAEAHKKNNFLLPLQQYKELMILCQSLQLQSSNFEKFSPISNIHLNFKFIEDWYLFICFF